MTREDTLFDHADVAVVRATTVPSGLPDTPDDLHSGEAIAWLDQVWRREEVRQAVLVASPVLHSQLDAALSRGSVDEQRLGRLVRSLASYLLRWQGRPTPFGLFAGVAAARVGGDPAVRWGERHRAVVRADAEWIGAVIRRLENRPDVRDRLRVVANSAVFARGDRLVVPGHPPEERRGGYAAVEVSVRQTRLVRAAIECAGAPVRFGDLVERLAAQRSDAPREPIRALLAELVARHFLITSLRAPTTIPDALAHLLTELDSAGTGGLPDIVDLARELHAIHHTLSHHTGPAEAGTVDAVQRMRAVCDLTPQPLRVDLALDCDLTLPQAVAHEAAAAASLLLRLTPYPFGYPRWRDYHLRFRQRYGIGAMVRLLDLVSDAGLGLPAGYLGSAYRPTAPPLGERDHTILALIQQAMFDGCDEIVLDETMIAALTTGDPAEVLVPPRAEVAFQVHAASLDAVRRGDFRLVLTGVPRSSSSMAGRFADLLPESDRVRLAATFTASAEPDALVAALSFPPRQRRSDNVVRAAPLLSHTITLSEHRGPHRELIGPDDLAVTADARQFYLVHLATGRHIEPRIVHALEPEVLTPPLARFLAEITTARCAAYRAFDWAAARRLPYLPRLRHGRIVLSSARWRLTPSDLPPRTAPLRDWETALSAWRDRLRVPAVVALCQADLRLPLNLDHRAHRQLLRARLQPGREVELREAPTSTDLGWIGRAHELLVPLRSTRRSDIRTSTTWPDQHATSDVEHLPGASAWLCAQIHAHPDRHDEILTDHLPGLVHDADALPLWWFDRHRDLAHADRDPRLDVYVRLLSPDRYGVAAAAIGRWAADLSRRGLVSHLAFATHRRQTGRFGHGPAMDAAEQVFAADSTAALAQISLATRTDTAQEAITAAAMVDLATAYTDDGPRWLVTNLPREHGTLNPALRDQTLHLADPHHDWARLRAHPAGEPVVAAWQQRRHALAAYRGHLTGQRDPDTVLPALLHLHHVRTIGVDPDRERLTHRLARAAALRLTTSTHGNTP